MNKSSQAQDAPALDTSNDDTLVSRIVSLMRGKTEPSLREAIEEYIEDVDDDGKADENSISNHERVLLSNVLKLRDNTAANVMVPRADIVAIDVNTSERDLLQLLAKEQYSRIPVYKDSLDDIMGAVHIKDILETLAQDKAVVVEALIRDLPVISPTMDVLDILLHMRESRKHMAVVIDEYGGVDGIVTVGDVIEAIIGELDDEHDNDVDPELSIQDDGTILADARFSIADFEDQFGAVFTDLERDEHETLGGIVFMIAGHIPSRGEVLTHDYSGFEFEVVGVAPRRITKLKIRNVPILKK